MVSQRKRQETINELIVKTVKTKRPANVEELVKTVQKQSRAPKETIAAHIAQLRDAGKIVLEEPMPQPKELLRFLVSRWSRWFWIVTFLVFLTAMLVMVVTETAPLSLMVFRWVFGALLVLYIPGYCLVEALYPSKGELDDIERIALSIGLSLAISPLILLVLNFTPWGIRLTPFLISLIAVTMFIAIVAVVRKFNVGLKK